VPSPSPANNPKSGTTVVKSAPPKETARITVKPSLPGAGAVRPAGGGNLPTVKPAAAVAVAAAAGVVAGVAAAKTVPNPAAKPAATLPGTAKPATVVAKSGAAPSATPSPSSAKPTAKPAVPATFQEEPTGSTLVTTILAGALAALTWGTAGILAASYFQLF